MIGYNQDYLQLFIGLLSNSNEVCSREVLNLLESLPYNNDMKDYLRKYINGSSSQLNSESKVSEWDQMMTWNGKDLSNTVYFLMGLEELMIGKKEFTNPEQQQQENIQRLEFCQKVIQKNGFSFMYTIFC